MCRLRAFVLPLVALSGSLLLLAAAGADAPAAASPGPAGDLVEVVLTLPEPQVRWHYGVVVDGMAVVVPRSQLARLRSLRGATVWPSVTYHTLLNRTPQLVGAPAVWGPTLATAGQGTKIGIIDDGLDRTHVFFDPGGFAYPAGFPKGNTAYTSPKVIVARAFAPARPVWKY